MMNVVDSSGWLEYLTDSANADFFARPIDDVANLVTPTICLYEVFKQALLKFGEERALNIAGVMMRGRLVDLNRETALEAARISVDQKLSMADSIILATAQVYGATLWTQDAHFQGIENVRLIEKPKD